MNISQQAGQLLDRQLALRTHQVRSLPILILMPHSSCNCRCVMCDIWRANKNQRSLTLDDLRPHVESMRQLGVRWVTLSGGEALMHPNLWSLCELLVELEVKITLLSTGILLRRHAAEVVKWCDEVIVSLDGSAKVHDAIRRVPKAFDKLADGIAALREIEPDFPVQARCVLQQGNFADLPNIIDTAHALKLNQISFLPADISSTAFNRPEPWDGDRAAEVALSPEAVLAMGATVDSVIAAFEADFASGFIAESPAKLRRFVQYYAACAGFGDFPRVRCNAPWVSAVVEVDGQLRPCFFHEAYGSIHDAPLAEVLNSKRAVAFRRGLNIAQNEICQRCTCSLNLGWRTVI